ncbi:hypothetical protein LNJ08_01110 [Tenacibaculum finnmarkense genomovar ulcerans]|uniref:hypothetical protein n=1 Tax=Tenacibaculum finnmarkense TaxID=2781243 RepID=UPI001E2B8CB3|nr:hypothetical protein [Tenacibaculum finnmarkense]MCD8452993.1 hypothetical protein [Tenacibaculum finnmarkense genomovar ulcerans]
MKLYLYIANFENGKIINSYQKYDLDHENHDITINELDMVHFEIVSDYLIELDKFEFILGSTSFSLDENYSINSNDYHYFLSLNSKLFNESNLSFRVSNYGIKFSQLFLNELGYVKPQIIYKNKIDNCTSIKIISHKVSDTNFDLIIKYLMFNNYFDETVIYKTSLPTEFSNFQNSFLESLKLLYAKSKYISEKTEIFYFNSIKKYETEHQVLPYSSKSLIDDQSFDWLFHNLDVIGQQNKKNGTYDLKIKSKECVISNINQQVSNYTFNSYENRLILGYSKMYILLLNDLHTNLNKKTILRTRYSGTFYEYLTSKYYNIISLYINEITTHFKKTHDYFTNVLKVNSPVFEFPVDSYSLTSIPHYKNWFELMLLYKNLFSKEIKSSSIKNNLEIESFDKLFEVYVFYIIKGCISSNDNYEFNQIINNKNKLAGSYTFEKDSEGIIVTLYYESLPEEIKLLTIFTNQKNIYNPDYIIEFKKNGFKEFLILDAKYKKYNNNNNNKFKNEVNDLCFKYLHGLGVVSDVFKVSGLYILSINEQEKYKKVFKSEFDILSSNKPILPSIGGVEIDPKNFNVSENLILDIINKHKLFFEERISKNKFN